MIFCIFIKLITYFCTNPIKKPNSQSNNCWKNSKIPKVPSSVLSLIHLLYNSLSIFIISVRHFLSHSFILSLHLSFILSLSFSFFLSFSFIVSLSLSLFSFLFLNKEGTVELDLVLLDAVVLDLPAPELPHHVALVYGHDGAVHELAHSGLDADPEPIPDRDAELGTCGCFNPWVPRVQNITHPPLPGYMMHFKLNNA